MPMSSLMPGPPIPHPLGRALRLVLFTAAAAGYSQQASHRHSRLCMRLTPSFTASAATGSI